MAPLPVGRPAPGPPAGALHDAPLVAFVATTDLDRSHALYGEVLGLRRIEASPFANAYDARRTSLRVAGVDRHAPAPYTVLGWSVDERVTALERRGVAFNRYPRVEQDDAGVWSAPGGARVAWFQDPDGNVLSLTQPPPAATPQPRSAASRE
jgi:catechol 2,3-dioxygenase-like lactoylglutathione lyase family enzyme